MIRASVSVSIYADRYGELCQGGCGGTSGKFELSSELIGCLPIVQHFLARMGVAECLERHLPDNDARLRLAPAVVIGAVVRNIVVSHRPVYAIGEWAAPYVPGLLGSEPVMLWRSTTTESAACSTVSSTPTGRRSSQRRCCR